MKMCKEHWDMCRASVDKFGMSALIAKDGDAAMENIKAELNGAPHIETFDPLMSHNWHWSNNALENGGLYLMMGEYCPLCEFEKHMKGFVASVEVDKVSEQMREYCIEQSLIAKPS